ncbi:MAG TPA: hypothetical protein PKM63_05790 [Panacibacter sp.]|nr:hypothetical protein [Panacibacter sp.]HNP43776.1 hypothetical protein [Panacibacter sp.]
MSSNTTAVDTASLRQWFAAKLTPQALEAELTSKGLDAEAIINHVKAYKKLRNAKRQNTGFMTLGIGAVLGFIGCVMALINPIPELHDFFLYGVTMVAVVVIFIGFYFIFE